MKITLAALKNSLMRRQLIRYWVADPIFGSLGFVLHYVLRWVPLRVNSWIGAQLGLLAFNFYLKKEVARSRRNLAIIRPDLSPAETDAVLHKMYMNIGQTMCEYSILDKLWDKGRVQVDDAHILPLLQAKQPIIFTGVHLGNWEAQASYVHAKNIPLMAMYKPVRNRFSRKISEIARHRLNILTVPTDAHAMRKMYEHLANNGTVWLPIDDFKNNQVHTPRFNRPMVMKGTNATHIARLAQRFNAAVIPLQLIRVNDPPPSFKVIAHPPMYVGKDDAAVIEFMNKIDKLVEHWILERPEQWFMLHDLRL